MQPSNTRSQKALTPQGRMDLARENQRKQSSGAAALEKAHAKAVREKEERAVKKDKPEPLPKIERKAKAADAETGG